MLQNISFGAGESKQFAELGDFFRILATTGGSVDIDFYRNGSIVASAPGVQPGYSEKFGEPFDKYMITSSVVQTIQCVARIGSEVFYDVPPGGTLIFPASQGAYTHTAPAITGAAANALAAKSTRKALAIQNNDPAVTIWIRTDGTAAALAAPSIKIGPGGYWEPPAGYMPTGAISAIGSGATSAVSFVEG